MASSIVRILTQDGAIVGAGFLIASDTVLTCAHVVSDALGLDRDSPVDLGRQVRLDLPFVPGDTTWTAGVKHWTPVEADQGGDIAVLRLPAPLPGGRPLPMADRREVWDHETRAVGFTRDMSGGDWQKGRFRGPVGSSLVQLSRDNDQAVYVKPGFSGSPVWDDDLGAAVGMVVASQPEQEAQQAFVIRTETLSERVPELRQILLPANPFLGLRRFSEGDEERFFGRDEDISRVVTELKGNHPIVTLCGPSGSGKSSLARAGVVPQLRRSGWDVLIVDCVSTSASTAALATSLFEYAVGGAGGSRSDGIARVRSVDQVDVWLRDVGLVDAFHRATGRPAEHLLVVLDQAEALLSLPDPKLAETLELLFPPRRGGLRILATLRADVINTALNHALLAPVLTSGRTLPLAPMTRGQLHAVITRPLEQAPAVFYDPGLDMRILDDAGTDPGILPLLGFLLKELWDKQHGGQLSAATYQQIGGVKGALVNHAKQVWKQCVSPESEAEARRLLAGLVRVVPGGEATLRRPLTREEAGEERWRLAQEMAMEDKRLLVLYGGNGQAESVELVHEALITEWPELAEVVRDGAAFLNARAEIQHDLERWEQAERRADLLPGGFQLDNLMQRLDGRTDELTQDQREFLHAARRRHRAARKRTRLRWTAGALTLTLIATLTTFGVLQSQVSSQRAAEARSRALAVQSDDLVDTNPSHAALAALAAYEAAPTQEARNALLRRYAEVRDEEWSLSAAEGKFEDAAMSADGKVALVQTEGGRAVLFVRTAQGQVRQESLRLRPRINDPDVSFDGRRISYVRADDGVVVWHNVSFTGQTLVGRGHPLEMPERTAPDAQDRSSSLLQFKETSFSPDGRFLVESGDDAGVFDQPEHPVRVWDLETGRTHELPEKYAIATKAWFGPDNRTMVLEAPSKSMIAVDLRTEKMRRLTEPFEDNPNDSRNEAWVSADGTVALSCRRNPDVEKYSVSYTAIRVADGKVLRSYRDDRGLCGETRLAPSGTRFAREANALNVDWEVLPTSGDARPRKTLGPGPELGGPDLPLLGTADEPVVPVLRDNRLIGQKLTDSEGETAYGRPHLLGDGSTMLVRTRGEGDKLTIVETEGNQRVVSETSVAFKTPPSRDQLFAVNDSQTLMADVSDDTRVTVRRLPSLKKISEFKVAPPPPWAPKDPNPVTLEFLPADRLVTLSGSRVEHWDVADGRRLGGQIDLMDLQPTSRDKREYFISRHRVPGMIGVAVSGKPNVYAVDLRTGRERKNLRISLHDDLLTAEFLKDSRYMAVLTTGRVLELWNAEPGKPPRRVFSQMGPLESGEFTVGNPADAKFFVAYGDTIVFLNLSDPSYRDTYKFGRNQFFEPANTSDGKAFLGSPARDDRDTSIPSGPLKLTRLDPALWEKQVCKVVGRELTDDERDTLPGPLPGRLCPS
ncbi:hypothetical protein AA958_19185 [Streptomyces sp. CNQ-509]|nr:hypothetical protein AA958_19185 [Streptomyces sp. CNQ-509]